MASGQVGRLSVRVLPDTSEFNRDLKKVLDRAEKRVRASIQVDLDVTRASLANLKRQLEGIGAVVPVAAELDDSARRIKDQIEDINAKVTANVDVDAGMARAALARVARPRVVPLHVQVSASSLTTAMSTLAALSGARVLGDMGSRLRDMASNMDRALPKVAALTVAIGALSAAALAGTSNLLAIGGSLASIAPAALALPGIFTGFGVGMGVMIAALADIDDVLADLGPKFGALQDRISSRFWAQAEEPIRNLANKALPVLRTRLGEVATELGRFFGSFATAMSTPLALGQLDSILRNVRNSIDIAGEGIAYFTDAMMVLITAGSSYLPALASWFNRISESFAAWVTSAAESGKLFEWINGGIAALQDLGRVVANTGGILAGLATAAANAGGASLGALADGLEKVNAAINGPVWQGALTTVFRGAHDAMQALGPGVSALGDAFISLAPTLATVMTLIGQIGSVALTAISAAFQTPAFQGGLTSFFEGVLAGVQAIAPALPAVGAAFGSIASLAGTLAVTIGPVLGAALQGLAPVVAMVANAFAQIAPLLGGVLLTAVTALAPLVQQLAAAFLPLVTTLVGSVAPILTMLIGALLPPLQMVIQAIAAVLPTVGAMFALVATAMAQVVAAIAPLIAQMVGQLAPILMQLISAILPPLLTVVQAIVAALPQLVPLFVMIATAAMQILAAVAPLVIQLVSGLLPVFAQLASSVIPLVVSALATIIPPIIALVTTIIGTLLPVIQALLPVVVSIFQGIAQIITGVMQIISGVIQTVMSVISGNWQGAWQGIVQILTGVWNVMQGVVSTIISVIVGVIQAALSVIAQVWNSAWSSIQSFLQSAWDAIVSAVSSGIDSVVSFFSGLPGQVVGILSGMVGQLAGVGADMMAGLANGISGAAGAVMSAIGGVVNGAIDWAKGLLGIHSPSRVFMEVGEYTGDGLAKGLENRATAVQRATTRLVPSPSDINWPTASGAGSAGIAGGGVVINGNVGYDPQEIIERQRIERKRQLLAAGLSI